MTLATKRAPKRRFDQTTPAVSTSVSRIEIGSVLPVKRVLCEEQIIRNDFVVDDNIYVLAITETWLQAHVSDQLTVTDISPKGFAFHQLRRNILGGGEALLYKGRFKLKNCLQISHLNPLNSHTAPSFRSGPSNP